MTADGPPVWFNGRNHMSFATSFAQKALASVTALAASFLFIAAAASPTLPIA
jgi:hypothetical protein